MFNFTKKLLGFLFIFEFFGMSSLSARDLRPNELAKINNFFNAKVRIGYTDRQGVFVYAEAPLIDSTRAVIILFEILRDIDPMYENSFICDFRRAGKIKRMTTLHLSKLLQNLNYFVAFTYFNILTDNKLADLRALLTTIHEQALID